MFSLYYGLVLLCCVAVHTSLAESDMEKLIAMIDKNARDMVTLMEDMKLMKYILE